MIQAGYAQEPRPVYGSGQRVSELSIGCRLGERQVVGTGGILSRCGPLHDGEVVAEADHAAFVGCRRRAWRRGRTARRAS